ncbi:MAG: pectin acetylesterase-family hydrolase [Bryobacteraceae bacterium]
MLRGLSLALATAAAALAQTPNIKDAISCPNSPDGRQPYRVSTNTGGNLRKVVLTGTNAICNDGSPAVMYVSAARPGATEPDGPSANRWIIHFSGGSHCTDFEECATRWCGIGQWEGTLMTTAFEGPTKATEGLLGRNAINRLGDRNIVQLKYCSSDNWQGRKSNVVLQSDDGKKSFSLHFQGANIVDAALTALEQGVSGLPKLTDATDVLISGDSGGAKGARQHTDRIAARLKAANPNVRVRAQYEASFGPDFNGKQGFPAGDPRDPIYADRTAEFNRVEVGQQNAVLDESCLSAHPTAQYLCADDSYLEANHVTTPFFQIQDLQDRLLLSGLKESGATMTSAAVGQLMFDQMTALSNARSTALEKAAFTANPGVVGRLCGYHVTYGNDDEFLGKIIRSGPNAPAYSYYELLWNWMTGASPSVVIAPRPPTTPATPVLDSICNAKAPTAPPAAALATASSASYDFKSAVAPESIAVTFGSNLSSQTATASTPNWPTTLGGVQINVTDSRGVSRPAPLYFVSPGQVLYLIPAGTASGEATVAIGSQRATVQVAAVAPGIYSASQTGKGTAAATYIRIPARGTRTDAVLTEAGIPAVAGDQVYLILYGTGMRGGSATATVGDVNVPVAGPVAQGQYAGLDQINLGPLPSRVGLGLKEIVIRQGDALANITTVLLHPAQ